MRVVRVHRAFAGAIIVVGALVVLPSTPAVAAGPCSSTATRTLTGTPPAFTQTLAANERVDATHASWTGTASYPVYFDSTADSCWTGSIVTGTFPVTTTWNVYHGNAGFGFAGTNFTLNGPRVFNYGDGIRTRDNSDGFTINDAYLAYIHDDCIENDRLENGTVDNSFLDGCYVGFSARQATNMSTDGHLNTMTVKNSLVRLQAMPTVYSGSAAGHGGWFKWDEIRGTSPKLNITNTVFRADQVPNHQSLDLPSGYTVTCSHNTIVWLGPGTFPGTTSWKAKCPDTDITTNRTPWNTAARAWDIAHPGVITGPQVSVGDASIVEGATGARNLRFPLSLSSPPAAGKAVTVYWSTAPGTAGSSDFTPTKGAAVFTAGQVFKMLSVPVTPDATTESTETMALVVAGVDGGENHRERGVGTIVNDDPGSGVRLVVSDALVVEGDVGTRGLVVPIALTRPATADAVIKWSTVSTGSALPGSDYTTTSGTTTILAGDRFAYVTIPILAGTVSEGTETFSLKVASATNTTIIDNTGVITIRDDD